MRACPPGNTVPGSLLLVLTTAREKKKRRKREEKRESKIFPPPHLPPLSGQNVSHRKSSERAMGFFPCQDHRKRSLRALLDEEMGNVITSERKITALAFCSRIQRTEREHNLLQKQGCLNCIASLHKQGDHQQQSKAGKRQTCLRDATTK